MGFIGMSLRPGPEVLVGGKGGYAVGRVQEERDRDCGALGSRSDPGTRWQRFDGAA